MRGERSTVPTTLRGAVAWQSGSLAGMAQAGSAGQCLHSNFSTHLDHLV